MRRAQCPPILPSGLEPSVPLWKPQALKSVSTPRHIGMAITVEHTRTFEGVSGCPGSPELHPQAFMLLTDTPSSGQFMLSKSPRDGSV